MKINIALSKSNLNNQGLTIAESEIAIVNFWKWFKGSKVIDVAAPRVVYHGSSQTFDSFDINKSGSSTTMCQQGPGFYFTDNKEQAKVYLKSANSQGAGQVFSKNSHLFSVYLLIKKPLLISLTSSNITSDQATKIYSSGDDLWFYSNWIPFDCHNSQHTKEEIQKMSKEEKVALYVKSLFANDFKTDFDILSNIIRAYENRELMFNVLRNTLKADGVIYHDSKGYIYVAWSPNQIKSTDNNGTFGVSDSIYG